MKKLLAGVLLLLMLPIAYAGASYEIIVEENGNSLVILQIEGTGTYNVPLPLDVTAPAVKGALYVQAENGIEVSIGSTEKAVVVYKTSLLTAKKGEEWTFEMQIPDIKDTIASISLPSKTVILSTNYPGAIGQSQKYLKIGWQSIENKTVEVNYRFGSEAVQFGTVNIILMITVVILSIILIILITYLLKKNRAGSRKVQETERAAEGEAKTEEPQNPGIGKAKQHILKTLSGNEATVVGLILQNENGMKRNKLEKESRLAKSSLASCLNNLERKNILKIDKTYTVHFIELTDWFRGLN